MNVMQKLGPDSPHDIVPKVPRSNGKTFFLIFTYIWQKDVTKISQVPGPRAM